jgi:hypothetical protein
MICYYGRHLRGSGARFCPLVGMVISLSLSTLTGLLPSSLLLMCSGLGLAGLALDGGVTQRAANNLIPITVTCAIRPAVRLGQGC